MTEAEVRDRERDWRGMEGGERYEDAMALKSEEGGIPWGSSS